MKILKLLLATLLLLFAFAPTSITAQVVPVGVRANQQGNIVYFSVYNNTDSVVCVFPRASEAKNVNGSVVASIQVDAGESGVNIGAYAQANPNEDWSINVTATYKRATCA
jgi:hypothetical protein